MLSVLSLSETVAVSSVMWVISVGATVGRELLQSNEVISFNGQILKISVWNIKNKIRTFTSPDLLLTQKYSMRILLFNTYFLCFFTGNTQINQLVVHFNTQIFGRFSSEMELVSL